MVAATIAGDRKGKVSAQPAARAQARPPAAADPLENVAYVTPPKIYRGG